MEENTGKTLKTRCLIVNCISLIKFHFSREYTNYDEGNAMEERYRKIGRIC